MIIMAHEKTTPPTSLDTLIDNATSEVRTSKVEIQVHTESCKKCRGTGRFVGRNGRVLGQCFTCKGAGKFEFKTSKEVRNKNVQRAADRKAKSEASSIADFKEAKPEIWAWIESSQDFPYAVRMAEVIRKYGYLTEGQLDACQRGIDRRNAAAAERAARIEAAPVTDTAGIDRLKLAFDTAIAYSAAKGLKRSPKITIGSIVISPAKATSTNAGALYVKESGQYLGKIAGGRFLSVRECSDEQKTRVLGFVADPKAASEVYGRETGTCCVCNATLTSEWKLRGIGPICAEKFGW